MIFLVNLLVEVFLLTNLWAYFPGLWEPWFAPALLLPGAIFSHFWGKKGGIWWIDGLVQILWPLALRSLLFLIWSWFAGTEISPVDSWFFWFDKNFWPLYPLTVLFSLAAGTSVRIPGFRPWRVLIQGILLVLVFFPQGNFQNATYTHPLFKALALVGFLLFQLWLLGIRPMTKNPSGRPALDEAPSKKRFTPISRQKLRTWAPLALLLLPLLAAVLWLLLARYEQASVASGGGLMKPDLFRFDFSQFITLESEISMSDDLVMLYRREGTPQQQYVRRFVLSGYSPSKGFFVDPPLPGGEEDIPPVGTRILNLPDPGAPDRREETQEYYIVNFDPSSLLGLNAPVKVTPFEKWDQSSFVGSYQVLSRVPAREGWDLIGVSDENLPKDLRTHYTDYGNNQPIADLAKEVTTHSPSYFDKVWDILFYLKTNYYYSLKPGVSANGNQLEHFLFKSKKGYCSYFAFTMALMLRSLDIPARVSVGFFIDPTETMLNFYPVRANQAHAWVEVWFDGVGWIEFDPTSEDLAPGEEFDPPRGLEVDKFSRLIQEILNHTLRAQNLTESTQIPETLPWYQTVLNTASRWWGLGLGLVYLFTLGVLQGYRNLLRGRFSSDPRKRTRWAYLRGLDILRLGGHHRLLQQTPQDFAKHLGDETWHELTELYLKAGYREEFTPSEDTQAQILFKKGYRVWITHIPLGLRLLHSIFPWTTFPGGRHGIR